MPGAVSSQAAEAKNAPASVEYYQNSDNKKTVIELNEPESTFEIINLGNGNSYEGYTVDKKYNGFGTLIINGTTYKGNFLNGLKNGNGEIFNLKGGLVFSGNFLNDVKHGQGIILF